MRYRIRKQNVTVFIFACYILTVLVISSYFRLFFFVRVPMLIYVLRLKSINIKGNSNFKIIIVNIPSYNLLLILYNIPTCVTDKHDTGKLTRRNRNTGTSSGFGFLLDLPSTFFLRVVSSSYHLSTDLPLR